MSNLFDFKGGEIKIKVTYKGEEIAGMVVGQAMVLASPVWEKFIFPPWTVNPVLVNGKQIDFSEDDGEAMLTLLNIVHLRFSKVPKILDVKSVYQIAILCEQYDCHAIVAPWLTKWSEDENKTLSQSNHLGKEEWLYIAWAFGIEDIFTTQARRLVYKIELSTDGKPFILAGKVLPNTMPDKLLESVVTSRQSVLTALLRVLYDEVDKYKDGKNTVCVCPSNQRSCDAATYGGLILELGRNGLWPHLAPESIKESINSLANRIIQLTEPKSMLPRIRINCAKRNFASSARGIYRFMTNPVLDCHVRHMKLRNGTAVQLGEKTKSCLRCNTLHPNSDTCPSNPRKRPAE